MPIKGVQRIFINECMPLYKFIYINRWKVLLKLKNAKKKNILVVEV